MDMTNFMKDSPNKASQGVAGANKYLSNTLGPSTISTTTTSSSSNSSSCSSSNLSSLNTNQTSQNSTNNNSCHHHNYNSSTNSNSYDTNGAATAKLNNNGSQQYPCQLHHAHSIEDSIGAAPPPPPTPPSQTSIKKKAASIDSINAVERELDEVLKDLELNSQDLNEMSGGEFNGGTHAGKNVIELPITIQKNIKIEQCSNNTSSPLFNKPSPNHYQHNHFNMSNGNQQHQLNMKWSYGPVKTAVSSQASVTSPIPNTVNSDFSGT